MKWIQTANAIPASDRKVQVQDMCIETGRVFVFDATWNNKKQRFETEDQGWYGPEEVSAWANVHTDKKVKL